MAKEVYELDIPEVPEMEITDYTRSMLRRLFVFSTLGLIVSFGTIGVNIGLTTLISGVQVNSSFVIVFLVLANLYYSSLSIAGYYRGGKETKKQFDEIEKTLDQLEETTNNIKSKYINILKRVQKNTSSHDKNLGEFSITQTKSEELSDTLSQMQNHIFAFVFIQKVEYLTPLILSFIAIVGLIMKFFDNSIPTVWEITSTGKALVQ